MPITSFDMISHFLIVVGFVLQKPILTLQTPENFNFRHHCTSQHFNSSYNVVCDGRKLLKYKNLLLDSRNAVGIIGIDLNSFESINIISRTPSDWENVRKFTIRRCKKVVFNFQSTLRLSNLEIDSVDEMTLETELSNFSVNAQKILLSNVGKLNLMNSKSGGMKASMLGLTSVSDVNICGNLELLGELLSISQSNIDLAEHSMLALKFPSITVNESTKLYVQRGGQFNVSTNNFLIQESYIYMDGQVNISGYNFFDQKVIKFFNNSFYGIKKKDLHIYGNSNGIEFMENGIYSSDIYDVLDFFGETKGVTFTNNSFGCNICPKKKTAQAKYLENFGAHNFCDSTCYLTLARYQELLDQDQICNQDDSNVEDKILCSEFVERVKVKRNTPFLWWLLILVILAFLVSLTIVWCFFCKNDSLRFQTMPVVDGAVVFSTKEQSNQENKTVILRAFSNELYEQVDHSSENIYEIVDSPKLCR